MDELKKMLESGIWYEGVRYPACYRFVEIEANNYALNGLIIQSYNIPGSKIKPFSIHMDDNLFILKTTIWSTNKGMYYLNIKSNDRLHLLNQKGIIVHDLFREE